MTAQRRAVIRTMSGLRCAYSAAQIHVRAKRAYPRLGLVTVYRTLDLLTRQGMVERIAPEHGPTHFELADKKRHHDHLVCLSCGSIEPLRGCLIGPAAGTVVARGFRVTGHRLELLGTCSRCRASRR